MCEQVPYSVFGVECYFEVCLSKYVCDVGGFLTYIGEDGSLFLGVWVIFLCLGRWIGGCWGVMGKELLWRMLWIVFSFCLYSFCCRL